MVGTRYLEFLHPSDHHESKGCPWHHWLAGANALLSSQLRAEGK